MSSLYFGVSVYWLCAFGHALSQVYLLKGELGSELYTKYLTDDSTGLKHRG